jgi:hypothetical protein
MDPAPILIVTQSEPRIIHDAPAVERPAPSVEQQRLADEVFSREQSQALAALLGVQTGLVIVQHLVAETFRPDAEEEVRRKEGEPAAE